MYNYIQFHTIKLSQGQLILYEQTSHYSDYSSTELMSLFISQKMPVTYFTISVTCSGAELIQLI